MQDSYFDLNDIINSLVARKFFVAGLTGFITILAILYTLTSGQAYQATSTFSSPSQSSVFNINKLIYISETKESIFASFLTQLISRDLQKKVFVENDFLTKFNKNNDSTVDVEGFINASINSIKVIPPTFSLKRNNLIEQTYSVIMLGENPDAISEFLNILVAQADSKNIANFNKLNLEKTSIRLDQIMLERTSLLNDALQGRSNKIIRIKEGNNEKIRQINDRIDRTRYAAKQNRLNLIEELNDSAKLAKSLGIIENNFKLITGNGASSDLTIAIGESKDLPEWYLYGEKALIKRIELLESRMSDDPFIIELVDLNNQLNEVQNNNALKTLEMRQDDSPFIGELAILDSEKNKLNSITLSLDGAQSMNLVETARINIIDSNKRLLILLAFIGSFMISVFLVLIMDLLKPDEDTPA